jgi:hypothetical protein
MHSTTRERLVACGGLAITIACGLWVRSTIFAGDATWAQRLGTALWAMALVLVLRAMSPRWSMARTWIVAMAVAIAVELLQLTGIPRAISGWLPLARLFLGSDFDARDLLWLAIGVVLGAVVALGVRPAGHFVKIS